MLGILKDNFGREGNRVCIKRRKRPNIYIVSMERPMTIRKKHIEINIIYFETVLILKSLIYQKTFKKTILKNER